MLSHETGRILTMPSRTTRDPFLDHLDQEWPIKPNGQTDLPKVVTGLPKVEIGQNFGQGRESAVTRWLQLGKRIIPDGPRVEQFVDHRLWLCRADTSHALVATTELYDEYVSMCDLGGWRPVGKVVFLGRLAALGYPKRRIVLPTGDRPWVIDFSLSGAPGGRPGG